MYCTPYIPHTNLDYVQDNPSSDVDSAYSES